MIVSTGFAGVVLDRPEWLNHARWLGLTVYDFIFPLFVTLSGIGLAFAYRRSVSVAVTARRVVVLLVVGLVYNALMAGVFDPATLRYTGTLQAYAVLVLVSGLSVGLPMFSTVPWPLTPLTPSISWLRRGARKP